MEEKKKELIEKMTKYLSNVEVENPRVKGYLFVLQSVFLNDFDYEKKLLYLKSLRIESEYLIGQIETLEWLLNLEEKDNNMTR